MLHSIFCDFDGTIAKEDSTDLILNQFSVDNTWKNIELQWSSGTIGSRECLIKQFSNIRMNATDIFDLAGKLHLENGFIEFSQFCKDKGIPLFIISDGINTLIEQFLTIHKIYFTSIYANDIKFMSEKMIKFIPLSDSSDLYPCIHNNVCANCKPQIIKHIIKTIPIHPNDTIYIGDGISDIEGARHCSTVFAKEKLFTLLRDRKKKSCLFRNFHEILQIIQKS
ncbi:MAG: MtnX-like HAD-IB family phosphatase [Candidatus Moranbacteria bacterium]|nr:MtnX-like HAD-IB family phosphatase [Candidatus Moranbacteria bacterium]MDD3964826.1 MtnX-like HAD-IB family phosphatase [Candidatus Moranbacteria bacterium]